jgi:hypothetical protein
MTIVDLVSTGSSQFVIGSGHRLIIDSVALSIITAGFVRGVLFALKTMTELGGEGHLPIVPSGACQGTDATSHHARSGSLFFAILPTGVRGSAGNRIYLRGTL